MLISEKDRLAAQESITIDIEIMLECAKVLQTCIDTDSLILCNFRHKNFDALPKGYTSRQHEIYEALCEWPLDIRSFLYNKVSKLHARYSELFTKEHYDALILCCQIVHNSYTKKTATAFRALRMKELITKNRYKIYPAKKHQRINVTGTVETCYTALRKAQDDSSEDLQTPQVKEKIILRKKKEDSNDIIAQIGIIKRFAITLSEEYKKPKNPKVLEYLLRRRTLISNKLISLHKLHKELLTKSQKEQLIACSLVLLSTYTRKKGNFKALMKCKQELLKETTIKKEKD